MSKDLWFSEMERLMSEGASYDSACERAHVTSFERLVDHADYLRKRAREEGVAQATETPSHSTADATDAALSAHTRHEARSNTQSFQDGEE